MKLKRLFFLIAGCICLVLGCVGIALPVLPTVPFFLATALCFSQSTQKLHDWFLGTKIYRNHLESYVRGRGMTAGTKVRLLLTVTVLMGIGFVMMLRKALYLPCGILACVWAAHIVYFGFRVKTIDGGKD